MKNRYLLVMFNFPRNVKSVELEPVFSAIGDDWFRFSPLTWILWTPKPATDVYVLLKAYLEAGDSIFISALSKTDMIAQVDMWVWDWLNSKDESRPFQYGSEAEMLPRLRAAQLPYKE